MQDVGLPGETSQRFMDAPDHPAQAPLMGDPTAQAREIGKRLARLAEEAEASGFAMLAYLIRMAAIEARTEETRERR